MSVLTRVCILAYSVPVLLAFLFLHLLWLPYVIGQTIIFLPFSFFLSFFYSSPNLSGHRLDGVALVRILNAALKCAVRGSLQIQDAKKSPKIAIWAPSDNFVGLYLRN